MSILMDDYPIEWGSMHATDRVKWALLSAPFNVASASTVMLSNLE